MIAGEFSTGSGFSRSQATRERERRAATEAIHFPDDFPPVRRIAAGMDDSIWVLRELRFPELVDLWQVYSAEGRLEGEISIEVGRSGPYPWAQRLDVVQASRTELWGVTLGEFDEPYLHRYRVVSAC